MDELLKGKTILIGREPGKPCLLVAVSINGVYKAAEMADCLPVPDSVSRCKVAEGSAHCKLEIDVAGSVRLINLKAANLTYVNGVAVESKKVSESDNIALGREKYAVSLKKDGLLFVSGFYTEDFPMICSSARRAGLEYMEQDAIDNWCCAGFRKV